VAPLYPGRRKGIRPLPFDLISSWRTTTHPASGPWNPPRNVARVSLARLSSDPTRCYASTNRRSRQATYPAVCSKRATLLGSVDRANGRLQRARNRTSGWNVKWPAVRAWGL